METQTPLIYSYGELRGRYMAVLPAEATMKQIPAISAARPPSHGTKWHSM